MDPAWLPVGTYTQRGHFDPVDKDPINLAYVGTLGDLEFVRRTTMTVLGLGWDWYVGDQLFVERERPRVGHVQDFNLANRPLGSFGRTHTRIYQLLNGHPEFGTVVVSPIHEESWAPCDPLFNDAVKERGFDSARDWAVAQLVPEGHEILYIPLPQFGPVDQCNRQPVDTDGLCAVVAEAGFFDSVGYPPTYSKLQGRLPAW
jgi:hypothetical protein